MGGTIFINYRRGEDAGVAGRLYDRLERTFGPQRLFMDVDNIPPGEDFVAVLKAQVAACDVLLALIGRSWLTATDETGRRRLDNAEDFVRIEIAAGLAQGKRVIPVLLNDATMPRVNELPEELMPLVRRQAIRIAHDRFKDDTERLARALEKALGEAEARRQAGEEERRRVEEKAKHQAEGKERRKAEEEQAKRLSDERLAAPPCHSTKPLEAGERRTPDRPGARRVPAGLGKDKAQSIRMHGLATLLSCIVVVVSFFGLGSFLYDSFVPEYSALQDLRAAYRLFTTIIMIVSALLGLFASITFLAYYMSHYMSEMHESSEKVFYYVKQVVFYTLMLICMDALYLWLGVAKEKMVLLVLIVIAIVAVVWQRMQRAKVERPRT